MKQFEYEAVTRFGNSIEFDVPLLNKMGKEGWELVSVVSNNNQIIFYFKRPKL